MGELLEAFPPPRRDFRVGLAVGLPATWGLLAPVRLPTVLRRHVVRVAMLRRHVLGPAVLWCSVLWPAVLRCPVLWPAVLGSAVRRVLVWLAGARATLRWSRWRDRFGPPDIAWWLWLTRACAAGLVGAGVIGARSGVRRGRRNRGASANRATETVNNGIALAVAGNIVVA